MAGEFPVVALTLRPRSVRRYGSETPEATNLCKRWSDMHRTPEDLRELATHCRHLAASCITEQARQPLNEVADELELEADKQLQLRQRLIGSGRY